MAATDLPGEPALLAFRARLSGELLRPGDGGYDDARALWNGRFDRRPALIARCRTDADVIAAVEFAREYDLGLAVKSSGHDYAGNAVGDGGLTIDLTPMNAVGVDPPRRRRACSPEPGGVRSTARRRPSASPRPVARCPPSGWLG